MPVSSSSLEVDNNELLTEVNGIKLPSMVEENIDYSSCTVDNESNSPHAITDHLSDGVTLAVADSTTPEVDREFEKVWEQLKTYDLGEPEQAPHRSVFSVTMVGRDKHT